ncbi:MAG TPA: hypothetical protein VNI55_13970 [Gaiellaceae bacterium]|nr:hypothetical protein [Gaiellaceae bacterium]
MTTNKTTTRALPSNVITRIDPEMDRWLRGKMSDEGLSRSETLRLSLRASMLLDKLHDSKVNARAAARALGGRAELESQQEQWKRELAETWAGLFPSVESRFRAMFPVFVLAESE